jgi:hypothetical protein
VGIVAVPLSVLNVCYSSVQGLMTDHAKDSGYEAREEGVVVRGGK